MMQPDAQGGPEQKNGPENLAENGPEKNAAFDLEERRVADVTGLQKKVLAQERIKHLVEGRDWMRVGTIVRYAQSGLEKLMGKLGLKDAISAPAVVQAQGNATEKADVKNGRVLKKFTNRHLIEVALEGPVPQPVRLWVQDSKNFKVGMAVPLLEPQPGGNGFWRLGRRAPRSFGRW